MLLVNNNKSNQIQNFNGKSPLLKDADWICRKVKTTFPAISPNRLYYENTKLITDNEKFYKFIYNKGKTLKQDRKDRKFLLSPFEFLKKLIHSTQEHKIAHCGEYSSLAEMIARMNGIENCYRIFMKDYDHTFLLVKEKPLSEGLQMNDIIIDPWLGISGYLKDISSKYQFQYNNIFHINGDKGNSIVLKPKKTLNLKSGEIDYFKEQFPQLIFKSRDGHKLMDFNDK